MADEVPPCPVVRVLSPQSIAQGPERAYADLQVPIDRREEAFSAALDEAQKLIVEASEPWWWKWLSDLFTAHVDEYGTREGLDSSDECKWVALLADKLRAACSEKDEGFKAILAPLLSAPPSTDEDVRASAEFCAEEAFRQRLLRADGLLPFLLSLGVNCADIEGAFKRLLAEAGLNDERKNEVALEKESDPSMGEWDNEPGGAEEVTWEDDEGDGSAESSEEENDAWEDESDESTQGDILEDDDAAIQRLVEEEVASAAKVKQAALEAAGVAPEPPKKERKKSAKKIAEEKAAAKEAAKALEPAAARRAAAILTALKGLKALGVQDEVFSGALEVSRATVYNILSEKRGARLSGSDKEFRAVLGVAMDRTKSFAEIVDFLETEAGRPSPVTTDGPDLPASVEGAVLTEEDDDEWEGVEGEETEEGSAEEEWGDEGGGTEEEWV